MFKKDNFLSELFRIKTDTQFKKLTLELFRYQASKNKLYSEYLRHLNIKRENIQEITDIPFLPISFFKSSEVKTSDFEEQIIFTSSGTESSIRSRHYVKDLDIYKKSFRTAFQEFYGSIEDYCVLALLPSYLEREGSSLIYMCNDLILNSAHNQSGFYLDDLEKLAEVLDQMQANGQKCLLIGVSFALLDLAEKFPHKNWSNICIMETGGMKGRRKEVLREELHAILNKAFGTSKIHSEYGMTELLSQAYSSGEGFFESPSWMKFQIRRTDDPFSSCPDGKTGGINIIDLANIDSCAFIETQDLGRISNNRLEIMGRFDQSEIRGCNLLIL